MNKAFVREPDPTGEYCPRCGALGQPVREVTLAAHLKPEAMGRVASEANFCASPNCEVVYFDSFERFATADDLVRPVWPKDPDAPICACFGQGRQQIDEDIAEGSVERTKALVAQSRSPQARCQQLAADGRSCEAAVQAYYMRHR